MTLEEILQNLTVVEEGAFPEAAILAAREQKDEIIPHLLQALSVSPEELDNIFTEYDKKDEAYWLFDFSAYLLAEFRVQETFPLLVDFFSTPGELAAELNSDFVTESLPQVLASTFNGDLDSLLAMIQNTKLDDYIRTAAIQTVVILQQESIIDREQIIMFFIEYIAENDWEGEFDFSGLFVHTLAGMKSTRLRPQLEEMFDDEHVDTFFIDKLDVEEIYSGELSDRIPNLITDTVAELKDWAAFKTKAELDAEDKKRMDKFIIEARAEREALQQRYTTQETHQPAPKIEPVETYQRKAPKVGRNDPCPCGSGKKYKKCCLPK